MATDVSEVLNSELRALVNGTYAGALRLRASSGTYLSYTLTLHTQADAWQLKTNPSLGDYWIFRTDVNQCLQDDRNEYFVLHWWNADGHAQWPPQDWETFRFELSGSTPDRVVIKSQNDGYLAPGSVSQNNGSPHFYCDHPKDGAASFAVEFI